MNPQPPRPLIGLNTDYIPASKMGGAQIRVHAGYADSIYASGGLPILIPSGLKEEEQETILDKLDGFVMIGGLDMDPKRQGLNMHQSVVPMPARREDSDRALCKLVLERQMPLMAVAVGMHMVNVLSGGTIMQHIPEECPKAIPHKDPGGGPHRHMVVLEPDTRIMQIYGDEEILVNSYHHQAVDQVGAGLKVTASSPDGIIECLESQDPDWFFIGVQWHPHSETASALDLQLFQAFMEACTRKEVELKLAA